MADGTEASRRVREVLSGIKGMIGTVGGAFGAAADLAESALPVGAVQVNEYTAYAPPIMPGVGAVIYYLKDDGTGWYTEGEMLGLTQTNQLFPVSETAPTGGGGGGGITYDPLEGLREQQLRGEIEQAASEEARAAEMQPLNIANAQSEIEYRKTQDEIDQKNLERQILADKFSRASDAFQASNLADQLAQEKQKTATTLLSSIVDALVPSTPSPIGPYPVTGTLNWNAVTSGANPQSSQLLQQIISQLNPQTDQATQYLMSQGV